MTCSEHQRIIDDIGDVDRLPPASARHVDGCGACAAFARDLVSLRALLNEQGRVTAPSDFDARLARRIRDARVSQPAMGLGAWLVAPQRMLATAAAFALVATGAYVVTSYRGPVSGPAPSEMAANRAVPAGTIAAGPTEIAQSPTGGSIETGTGVSEAVASPSVAKVHSIPRRAAVARSANFDDALLLVQDSAGARVVNVPRVLVGAERVVPVADADTSVAALDDRMAF